MEVINKKFRHYSQRKTEVHDFILESGKKEFKKKKRKKKEFLNCCFLKDLHGHIKSGTSEEE